MPAKTLQLIGRPVPPTITGQLYPDIFVPAPELEEWVRRTFIDDGAPLQNPDHQHLQSAILGFLWTNKSYRRQQRWIVGLCEDPSGGSMGAWKKGRGEQQLTEWFGDVPDFVITLYAPMLATASDRDFCSVIEHELYHAAQDTMDTGALKFRLDGRPAFAIRAHDVEEFTGVVRRYGGNAHVRELVAAANKAPLITDEALAAAACGNCAR